MQIVVGLGQVDSDIVQPVLGPHIRFVENPTAEDIASASGAIVRAAFKVDQAQLDSMPELKVIARTGVGTEHVDVVAASARNIPVIITPGSNTNAVAEGAMAHALHLVKRLGPLNTLVRDGGWDKRTEYPVFDLENSTIGIVGYGRIGRRVADLATAFGMNVLAYDPYAEIPAHQSVANLEELALKSDLVTLHVPLTNDTHHLVDTGFLAKIKPGAVIVNCGRGPLIDLDAAHAALKAGRLGGLGLDVYDQEPPAIHPVFSHENVVLTPHVMGLSVKATQDTYRQAAEGVKDVLEGRPAPNAVNP